ncbi:Phosphate butyryltransferase [Clostridiaceae bacterium JG1575]|nr:Phosphate butyryltransferase [Clostridiaceae bacterium JG1575]
MKKIAVSACLLGHKVRYDGQEKGIPQLMEGLAAEEVLPLCPEVLGGLPIPRAPAERTCSGCVKTKEGQDVTAAFKEGAQKALHLCQAQGVTTVLLKERSPSCGVHERYDGRFCGQRIPGAGVFTELLRAEGIKVYSEEELPEFFRELSVQDAARASHHAEKENEMITRLEQLKEVSLAQPAVLAVAAAEDEAVIEAVLRAKKLGLVQPLLFGEAEKIRALLGDEEGVEVVGCESAEMAAHEACRAASEGRADMILKGLLETKTLLKQVLNKEFTLRQSPVLSHVMIYDVPTYHKLLLTTDGGMVAYPTLEQKKELVKNAVAVGHCLGIERPKVAALCAVEKVNEKMPCTLDARDLVLAQQSGELSGCILQGPLALDNAISKEAAKHKGLTGEVVGDADVLLVPSIEAGNMLGKSLSYFAGAVNAGIIMGARVPILLVSRADTAEAKLYSILLGALVSRKKA